MNHLNEVQKKTVSIKDGSALIIAGAGSGKTTVISYRILNLINNNISPFNILTLTFTNKATKEMKERIVYLNGGEKIKNLKILTFHSLGVYILKRYSKYLGLKGDFNIYGSYDQKKIYHEIFKEMHIDIEEISEQRVLSRISLYKNNYTHFDEIEEDTKENKLIKEVYRRYQEKMFSYSAFDFDDLLFYTLELFIHHPSVLHECQRIFKYVMVDEYQDTNRVQYLIAQKICEVHGNLFVVGDDDQSIYAWRGADIRNIMDFKDDFPLSKIIKLEENYRSTNFILRAANSLIDNNENRHDKNLYSHFEDGKKIQTFESATPKKEAEIISGEILMKRLQYGSEFRNFAVLFRTNAQSKIIEDTFVSESVPFVSSNQYDLYERKEIKDIMAYLRLLHNTEDDMSFLRIINFPKRGITNKIVKGLTKYSMDVEKSIYESIEGYLESHDVNMELSASLITFKGLIDKYQQKISAKAMYEEYVNFLSEIEFYNNIFLEEKESERAEKRIAYVEQFNEILKKYVRSTREPSLGDYLKKLALFLYGDKSKDEFEEDAVHLLTIHSAKGLEFDYVYVVGLEEGILPFQKEGEEMNIDEERRLTYVAITRAKKELTLSLSVSRKRNGVEILSEPSRFLDEIDEDVIYRNYGSSLINNEFKKRDDEVVENMADKTFDKMRDLFK